MIGETISHYTILKKLGEGGMGVVYKARDIQLDRFVALKFLPAHLGQSDEEKQRFIQEAKAASALDHNNIGVIYEFGETQPAPGEPGDGRLFIVMACYDGGTLQDRIARQPLSTAEAVDIAIQLADGLSKAHAKDIVHRDIKPANILLTEDGQVKIVDFGLAKLLGRTRITKESSTLGTVSYMSPEQTRGLTVDHRTDIWSFGVVLYEMLTGQRPFRGDYDQAVVYSILHEDPNSPASLRDEVPEELEGLINSCLEKEPEKRAQHFSEVLDRLRLVQGNMMARADSGAVTAHVPGQSGGVWPARWKAVGFIGSFALIAAVGFYLLRPQSDTPPAAKAPPAIKQLTSFLGVTYSPSWNPDGSIFAYCHTGGGAMNIYVTSPGGEPHQLTDTPFDEIVPRWSPTGDKIAFISDRGNGTEIFWIAPTGGQERRLTNTYLPAIQQGTAWFRGLGFAPWSADGKELLFHRMQEGGGTAIWKINLDSHEETQLTFPPHGVRDLGASWSPDGRSIAFDRSSEGKYAIWLLPASGGPPQPFIQNEHSNFCPAWTPDGKRIVFLSFQSGLVNIWEKELDGGVLSPLTNQTSYVYAFSISSRGALAFSVNFHSADLHLAGPGEDPDDHQNLTRNTINDLGASVTPDGNSIYYYSDRTGNFEIWMYNPETGDHIQVTDHPAVDVLPDCSPQGQLLFVSNRGGTYQLWRMEQPGEQPSLLSDAEVRLDADLPNLITTSRPLWSPDGGMVGFMTSDDSFGALWLLDAEGGVVRQTGLDDVLGFDWYLDAKRLVYVKKARNSGIGELRVAHLETGEDKLLLAGLWAEPVVTPSGDAVAYLHAASHYNMNVFRLPLTPPTEADELPVVAGQPEQLTDGKGVWHVHNLSWFPDGKRFVYTRDSDFGDIFVLENDVGKNGK